MELLKDADVLLTNFKRGDDQKFGLETKKLHALNPGLIVGKISGFGEESDRVAYDLILQAETHGSVRPRKAPPHGHLWVATTLGARAFHQGSG